ncbi:ABC transporter ATP-binding protein [soil metagenome]
MSTIDRAIEVRNLDKSYPVGRRSVPALQNVDLSVAKGDYVAIVGPSGCGKSTLLNILAGIDSPDAGEVIVNGTSLAGLSQNALAAWRGKSVGIVFQFFQLMPTLTAIENIMLPMDLAGRSNGARKRSAALLERVGLAGYQDNLPSELSGGEQQRIAVARSLANAPQLILADEPTGNLDSTNGGAIVEILESLWVDGTTIMLVTHDPAIAERSARVIGMRDGRIVDDQRTHRHLIAASAV